MSNEELEALKDAANAKASALQMVAPVMEAPKIKEPIEISPLNKMDDLSGQLGNMSVNQSNLMGGAPNVPQIDISAMAMPDPQNTPTTAGQPDYGQQPIDAAMDPEFLQEIEHYLIECKDNNEASIDMSETLIQDHGAKMVAAVAAYCSMLQELRLQTCGITDVGAIELFTELRNLPNLKVIDISNNPVTEKSLDALTALLNSNPDLMVSMRKNNIQSTFAARKVQHFTNANPPRLTIDNS